MLAIVEVVFAHVWMMLAHVEVMCACINAMLAHVRAMFAHVRVMFAHARPWDPLVPWGPLLWCSPALLGCYHPPSPPLIWRFLLPARATGLSCTQVTPEGPLPSPLGRNGPAGSKQLGGALSCQGPQPGLQTPRRSWGVPVSAPQSWGDAVGEGSPTQGVVWGAEKCPPPPQ